MTQEIKERELRIAELRCSKKKESFALLPPLKTFGRHGSDPPDVIVKPKPADFVAEPLGFFKMLPGSGRRKEARLGVSKSRFEQALEFMIRARFIGGSKKTLARAEAAYPLGRIGEPEEIAGMAVLLASRAGNWITGQTIRN